ncbi:MAG: phosphoribosylformimino-5-aminoimidazole carboxamide ribotide isomerase [Spirochaetes bacterium]|nr:phosphoribosylformimino-5-aminoimidazole carboxamide ribotide isomerase [Spirochaetota bacterium]
MKFRPCIDLHEGKVKQIVGKSLSDEDKLITNFISDKSSSWYAKLYKNDGLFGGHVIMLGKGNEKAAKEALSAFRSGLQAGGGINCDNAHEYIDAGASGVIVTSYVFKNGMIDWDNLKKLNEKVDKEKIIIDLSCRYKNNDYYIVTDRWQKFTDIIINIKNIELLEKYCSEFLVHAVDVEGMMCGIDKKLIEMLSEIVDIPITYAGGITTIEELDIIDEIGKGRIDATVGSALDIFGGKLSYKKVVEWHNRHNR